MTKQILVFLAFILFVPSLKLQAQACDCTNCPQFMQDLFVGGFDINVQGATNNTLGQNGQGVCGVIVHWDHTAICDISITLTSPSGQTVTLVGPIGQFCTNNGNAGTDWNVTFLPCSGSAMPDPGFAAQWNSNQNWGANGNYSGSYFPFAGCLENFSGPVNGNWTLTVTDGQANDVGNLYDYEIIFCDPSGINCFSCVANAGALTQPNVVACENAPELNMDLPPTFTPITSEPPASDYTYTYVIAGTGGVIQAFSSTPDLSAYPAGNYTVCGMSYLTLQQNLVPAPNGALTVTQLTNQLNSNLPPFCGNITSNCVNVTINPIPPDEEEYGEVCAPECYDFLGDFYCQSGDYIIPQTNAQGCPYNSILHLTVKTPSFTTINETICPGGCSTNPAFPDACSGGMYQATLMNHQGCDSVVTLNLTVMNINASIQPPGVITCAQPSIPILGTGSTIGGGTSYAWTASNGGHISGFINQINTTVDAPGTYQLKVCRTINGITCCDSATVNVTSNIMLPGAPVISGPGSICTDDTLTYSVAALPLASSYTWTVPAGATILSGQGTTTLVVHWTGTSGGNICATASNSCGPGPQTCLPVTVANAPATPVVVGNNMVCKDSTYTYSVDSIPTATTYNWLVTNGIIVSGNDTRTISVQWNTAATSGTVCASASNGCGQSGQNCLPITINATPGLPVVTGDTLLCSGANGMYSIPALSGATGYTWTVPAGANIVSGQNTNSIVVHWNTTPGGNVCVHGLNSCGNGPDGCLAVVVVAQPQANAGLDDDICGLVYGLTATASVSGSTGAWAMVSGPGTASFANPASAATNATVSQSGVYQFSWTESVGATCVDADTVAITFFPVPVGGAPMPTCDGGNQNYTISFPISSGTAPYVVPGGTVSGGIFTSNPIPNGQSYTFTITDANGCVSAAISGVYNCNCTTNAGQMSSMLLTACAGDSVTAIAPGNAVFDADDAGAFVLHTTSGSIITNILAENTTGVFHLINGMTPGVTYYISYVVGTALNGLPDLMDPCVSIAPGQPVIFYAYPVANAGMDVAGCSLSLTVNGNPGVGTGVWSTLTTPAGGMLTIANPQNASTLVTANIPGIYSLLYTVLSNGCSDVDTVNLNYGSGPTAGVVSHICNGANTQFTVNFTISGGQAPYTVNGQAVVGVNFTSAPFANGSSYNLVITDANGCTSAAITGSFSCNCATFAGQMSLAPITACQSDSITVQFLGGQVLDADDTGSFVLHSGSGNTLQSIIAENHTGTFGISVNMTFGTTYYVSAVAGNNLNGFPDPADICFSVSQGQPIVFLQNPAPNAGSNLGACGLSAYMGATSGLFPGVWSQVSGPGTATFTNPMDPHSQVMVDVLGNYVFRWTETNGICIIGDDVDATFWENPIVGAVTETCNGINTGYTLSFSVTNGNGNYTINGLGGTFSGNNFSSVELPNDATYNFVVADQNGCQSPAVTGTFACPCTTDAGTMDVTPAIFCAGQPAIGVWNNNAVQDGNDAIVYILHDTPDNTKGTILAQNSQPTFNFGPGLQTGITYYISAVAGSATNNMVNLNDPCLSIAPGTPVQWKALPLATLSGDATICNGSSTALSINGTGAFPLSLMYDDGSGTANSISMPTPQSITFSVSPVVTTIYKLLSVTDGSMPNCTVTLNNSVTVTVNQPVNAGMAAAPMELCAGEAQTIALASLIAGEDAGGTWTETSITPSFPGAFNANTGNLNTANMTAGAYTFKYLLDAVLPCPDQSAIASVTIHPTPSADAGTDQMIDCHQDTAALGGAGTTLGAGIQYSWLRNGLEVTDVPKFSTVTGGVYTLVVSNSFGCSDSDAATVTVDNDIPMADGIQIKNVRCFGEENGEIRIDSVHSAHPPVLVSVNGNTFNADTYFKNLPAGNYVLTLQDANGCEWSTDSLKITQPPLLTANLGADLLVTFGDTVTLNAEITAPLPTIESLIWTPVMDSLHADTTIQRFLPLKSLYVDLSVADTNGCTATDRIKILVEKPEQVYVPNVIKPGSPGFNDLLVVYGGRGVAEIESFVVFDRWGSQMYEAKGIPPNDVTHGWDGKHRGENVLPGVYVYVAVVRFINGETKTYKGDVTVVR